VKSIFKCRPAATAVALVALFLGRSPQHNYTPEQQAYNAGLVDKFVEFAGRTKTTNPPCEFGLGKKVVMGYYDGNTVTALWNYAQHFAMSDNFYQTTFGSSAPGHINRISGQTHGLSGERPRRRRAQRTTYRGNHDRQSQTRS